MFYAQHRIEHALAFYDKVVDAWYKSWCSAEVIRTLVGMWAKRLVEKPWTCCDAS